MKFILGKPAVRDWEAAIVIQGPYIKDITQTVIRTFLERNNPSVIIIVSTYGDPEGKFLSDFERKQISEPECRLVYLLLELPSKEKYPEFWRTNSRNQNCQRLSTFMGLNYAKQLRVPLCLKCRADTFLGIREVCKYLESKYMNLYPVIPHSRHSSELPRRRIVISDHTKRRCDNMHFRELGDHFICDFWFFGETEDLLSYFDITSDSYWNEGSGIAVVDCSESHYAELWMKDLGLPSSMTLEELTARYMAVAESVPIEFVWMRRFHDHRRYLREGLDYLNKIFLRDIRFYLTHQIWLKNVEKLISTTVVSIAP